MRLLFFVDVIFYFILLSCCFLSGVMLVKRSWPLAYKLMVVLSALTLMVELMVMILYYMDWPFAPMVSNLFVPIECFFLLNIFYRASVHPVNKRVNIILLIFLPVGTGIILGLHSISTRLNELLIIFLLFMELVSSSVFLVDTLVRESMTPLMCRPLFWMACGMVIYCALVLMPHIAAQLFYKRLPFMYYQINNTVANAFMYGGFIASFVARSREGRESGGAEIAGGRNSAKTVSH